MPQTGDEKISLSLRLETIDGEPVIFETLRTRHRHLAANVVLTRFDRPATVSDVEAFGIGTSQCRDHPNRPF